MRTVFVVLAAAMCAASADGCGRAAPQDRVTRSGELTALVGTWRLVSCESRTTGGEVRYPLGRSPAGRLSYDAGGQMSAQLMDPGRPKFGSGDLARGSDAEVRAAAAGYIAYYGRYTLDPSRGVVVHHVEGALFPNWVGGDQARSYRLDGDRLTITTPPIRIGGEDSTTVLVWERAR
jgi:Lipocalin-like domain